MSPKYILSENQHVENVVIHGSGLQSSEQTERKCGVSPSVGNSLSFILRKIAPANQPPSGVIGCSFLFLDLVHSVVAVLTALEIRLVTMPRPS